MSKSMEKRLRAQRGNAYAKQRAAIKNPIEIRITTRVPSKWRFVDLETGEVWMWGIDGFALDARHGIVLDAEGE